MAQTRTLSPRGDDGAVTEIITYTTAAGDDVDPGDPAATQYAYARLDATGAVVWSEFGIVDPPGTIIRFSPADDPPPDTRTPAERDRAGRLAAVAPGRPVGRLDPDRLAAVAARRRATPDQAAAAAGAQADGTLEDSPTTVDPDELTEAEAAEATRRAALYGDVLGALEPTDPPVRA